MAASRSIGILFSIRMKHLISVGTTVFMKEKAIVETSTEWWFERFTTLKDGKARIKTLMYPCRLLRAITAKGVKINFPPDFKIHKDEWIVKLSDSDTDLQSPQILFQEFCKLSGYAGNAETRAGDGI